MQRLLRSVDTSKMSGLRDHALLHDIDWITTALKVVRPKTALILVLYCSRLRLGKAVRLRTSDIDLEHGTLMIQHSKCRSRLVSIRAGLVAELPGYGVERQRLVFRRRSGPETFFLRLDVSPLTVASASTAIRRLSGQLGLKPARGRGGACPYEFRHAFAVHRLMAWDRGGVDTMPSRCCPRISATRGSSESRCI